MPQFPEIEALFNANKKWAEGLNESEPAFLPNSAKGQAPNVLWMGCSDSRVPESIIMARKPGEIFVQRNIANQFQPNDDSANAILEYALGTVGVKHVVIAGHTSCGACIAAWGAPPPTDSANDSHLSRFLDPVVRIRHSLPAGAELNDLIKENIKANVKNVIASPAMQGAWKRAQRGEMHAIYVHGWMYDLATGHLKDLELSAGPQSSLSFETHDD